MNLARSSVRLFLAKILAAGLGFIGITYFARELGASQMGIFFLFQALLGMLAIPADFGLRGAVEKRISEGESRGAFLSSAILLKVIPIVVLVLVILLFQSSINGYLGADLAVFLAFAIVLQEAAQLAVVVLKGELRVGETAVLNVVRQVTWVGGGALLIGYGYGVDALIYSLLAGLVAMLTWGWFKSSVTLGRPSLDHGHSLFDYGKYNVISSIGGYFYSWMDVAIIGLFLTQADVGAYEVAWRVTSVTMLFSGAIAATIFPQVSQWDADDATDRIESVIHNAITPSLILVIPAFFGIFVFSREILGLLFGPEFTIASVVLVILAGEKILQAMHVILGRALQGVDRPDLAARATVISVVLNLVLNVVLILWIGIVGAAIATTVSFAVNTILHGRYLSRFVAIDLPYAELGWCVCSSTVMALVLLGVEVQFNIDTLPKLLVIIGFGATVYSVCILLFTPIRAKVIMHLRDVIPPTN